MLTMDRFEQEIKAEFVEEASRLLVEAEQCFLLLESNPQDTATLGNLFRIAHNIKGSSKAAGFDALGAFTHALESFMLQCKSGQIPILPGTISLLLKCNDHIRQYIDVLKENFSAVIDSSPIIAEIHGFKADESSSENPSAQERENVPVEEETVLPVEVEVEVAVAFVPEETHAEPPDGPPKAEVRVNTPSSSQGSKIDDVSNRYLCFTLGPEEYAVPLLSVKEVIALPDITPIPQTPPHFLGIMNLRGQVIAIMDLRSKLSIKPSASAETAVIICDLKPDSIGVVVDSLNSVLHPDPDLLSEKPEIQSQHYTDYIQAVYREKDRLILFLDISKILDSGDHRAVTRAASQPKAAK